jgi:hypothetical protein
MAYRISRREVLNNLIRFKDYLLELGPSFEANQKERIFKILLNFTTGDIRFAKKITNLESHFPLKKGKKEISKDWKEARLIVLQRLQTEPVYFEICDSSNLPINPKELSALAWAILSEMLNFLNARAKEFQGKRIQMLPEEAILSDLSSLELDMQKERIEDLPGWNGSLNRVGAEKKLKEKPIGSYLLREGDEITFSIAFHFAEENHLSVHPYLLTVVENEEKISDILLLQTNRGWSLYHDDPNLKDGKLYHYLASPKDLLASCRFARYPVF